MKRPQMVAIIYFLALGLLFWGYQVGRYEAFPYAVIERISAFVAGHSLGADTSVIEKLSNDVGLVPTRFLWPFPAKTPAPETLLDIPGLKPRRELPRVFMAAGVGSSYRAIFGALDFETALWGGVLIGPGGDVLHTWQLSTQHLPGNLDRDEQKNMYGLHLFPDGSVIFSQQESGGGIVKVDKCSNVVWNLEGRFHHTVSPTDKNSFWTFEGGQEDFDHVLAEISVDTGKVLRRIDMANVRLKNTFVHIFNLQRNEDVNDISHGNDIDPLPQSLAGDFPMFNPGDLLISYRTQNLVFVLDPDTLAIKWWRIGPWDRQHDADWEPGGIITVFSNNEKTEREFSDIVAIGPSTYRSELAVDGSEMGFASKINGDQQLTPVGSRIITSSAQGWVFEVDDNKEVIFSFLNVYSERDRKALHLSEAVRLQEGFFDRGFWKTCEKPQ